MVLNLDDILPSYAYITHLLIALSLLYDIFIKKWELKENAIVNHIESSQELCIMSHFFKK